MLTETIYSGRSFVLPGVPLNILSDDTGWFMDGTYQTITDYEGNHQLDVSGTLKGPTELILEDNHFAIFVFGH